MWERLPQFLCVALSYDWWLDLGDLGEGSQAAAQDHSQALQQTTDCQGPCGLWFLLFRLTWDLHVGTDLNAEVHPQPWASSGVC